MEALGNCPVCPLLNLALTIGCWNSSDVGCGCVSAASCFPLSCFDVVVALFIGMLSSRCYA